MPKSHPEASKGQMCFNCVTSAEALEQIQAGLTRIAVSHPASKVNEEGPFAPIETAETVTYALLQQTTRRSAGLPYFIQGIIIELIRYSSSKVSLLDSLMRHLMSVIDTHLERFEAGLHLSSLNHMASASAIAVHGSKCSATINLEIEV
ncbi:unnamed protein product [Protopolystoma xenopodis]|uniref:DUF2428 domain-containing protein n=1 Tax=Protopolystoma xenopodis TaxID=117903 RepID=A0A3S5FF15_9PLAT|nr:unnamed protein product [Protopolystoma xenopodis]